VKVNEILEHLHATVRKILDNDNITTKKKALVFKQLLPSIFEN